MSRPEYSFGAFLASGVRLWVVITVLFGLCNLGLYLSAGSKYFTVLIQPGPASIMSQTLACVAIAWLSWGAALVLLRRSPPRPVRYLEVVASLLILLLYLNVLRERTEYGDVDDYLRAAIELRNGTPSHSRFSADSTRPEIAQARRLFGR